HRRLPSEWLSTITSATPRTAAAALSSRARTRPRSPSGTSAGSLIDPASPRDAHSRITRTPASDSRAIVPPHASDSSSGCANTQSTVRPASGRSVSEFVSTATAGSDDVRVDVDVFVDHACGAETLDRARAHAAAGQGGHARQIVGHLFEIVEDHPPDSPGPHFPHGAAIERGDGRAARHGLGEDEPEGLARLNGVEERARATVELHLRVEVGFAKIHDMASVDVRRDALAIVVVFGGGEYQLHA